jgi:hypothetical protein
LHSKSIQIRLKKGMYQNHYANLNLILNIKAVTKINYIQCLIKRIELAKRLFVMDIEQGAEAYIPNDLRNSKLPLSFQYYDPIMTIVQQRMADDRKEYFIKKNLMLKDHNENSLKNLIMKIFEDKKTDNLVDKNQNV